MSRSCHGAAMLAVMLTLLLIVTPGVGQDAKESRTPVSGKPAAIVPIDFEQVPRTIDKLPELRSKKPLYALLLFGLRGEARVWCVLDQSDPDSEVYDVLHLDRDANGDLTGKNERFEGEESHGGRHFEIGRFEDPGQNGVTHTKFTVTWTEASARYSLHWKGGKRTFGSFGAYRELYAAFAPSPEKAPIFVPGYDRPLEFENWMSDKLTAGRSVDFKVFVGQRGSTRGSFSSVDDKFLPPGQAVQATLIYKDGRGKEARVRALLENRC